MQIVMASDHAGVRLREFLKRYLLAKKYEVNDMGTETATEDDLSADAVDYPHYAEKLAAHVAEGTANLGILVCGSGLGVSMVANKVNGIRAALCTDPYMATMARSHNDANVLCLGQRVVGEGLAVSIVEAFLAGKFEGKQHARRVAMFAEVEKRNA